ncbi:MAG: mannose-1-phosphate guanylyltransferase [Deltaproteobacteria bacterium]|nr:mannose-1-phosphate guanylyltransferase [Deltaproteobacteria bacterium]
MYAVIMAGGKGTRFWPRSREKMPKHLLDILNDKTIIRQTVDRITPLIPPERILIVTASSHVDVLFEQVPDIPRENILIEPVGRNTAPCIGLAALHLRRRAPGAVMVVLPADHSIEKGDRFRHILAAAAETARKEACLVTVGIVPTGPETGYGYLEKGERVGQVLGEDVYKVRSFREKPKIEQAEAFLRQGGYLWNSGMFVWKASVILDAIALHLPRVYDRLRDIEDALDTPEEPTVLDRAYRSMEPISIDYGVMEKSKHVLVLGGDFGWSDVGSWDALWEITAKNDKGNAFRGEGPFVDIDTRNSLIISPKKLVALVGVEDLVVVETGDALLICRRGNSQTVKRVVETIEAEKWTEYL